MWRSGSASKSSPPQVVSSSWSPYHDQHHAYLSCLCLGGRPRSTYRPLPAADFPARNRAERDRSMKASPRRGEMLVQRATAERDARLLQVFMLPVDGQVEAKLVCGDEDDIGLRVNEQRSRCR